VVGRSWRRGEGGMRRRRSRCGGGGISYGVYTDKHILLFSPHLLPFLLTLTLHLPLNSNPNPWEQSSPSNIVTPSSLVLR